ncbi:hypothetical protein HYV91_03490 [Candidatus Wolfebacteria bacterium]|nr:hypothetical protein [Candidatus Wolfebacteria bacterium]
MNLKIISLKGAQFEGEVVGFNVKTAAGEITILDHHRPIISSLILGAAVIIGKDENRQAMPIKSGFLEMDKKNNLTVLID